MSVLVDTSVWVGHFKQRNEHLVGLLESGLVRCHHGNTQLWTQDKRLAVLADEVGVAYEPGLH